MLHGKPVEAIRDLVTEFVKRHASTMDNGGVSRHTSQSYLGWSQCRVRVDPVVRVLAVFKDFADCLDGEGLYGVPVLLPVLSQAYLVPEVEPLSWG